jgi:hypothetical protein
MRGVCALLLAATLLRAAPASAAATRPQVQSAPSAQRTWKSVFGLSLGGAGLVALGTGVARVLRGADYAQRERAYAELHADTELADYQWLFEQAAAAKTQGALLLAIGAAALVGGALLFWLDTPPSLTVGLGFSPGTVSVAFTARW